MSTFIFKGYVLFKDKGRRFLTNFFIATNSWQNFLLQQNMAREARVNLAPTLGSLSDATS
jgi:hypothetical protein